MFSGVHLYNRPHSIVLPFSILVYHFLPTLLASTRGPAPPAVLHTLKLPRSFSSISCQLVCVQRRSPCFPPHGPGRFGSAQVGAAGDISLCSSSLALGHERPLPIVTTLALGPSLLWTLAQADTYLSTNHVSCMKRSLSGNHNPGAILV